MHFNHFSSLLFAGTAAYIRAHDIAGDVLGGAVQPARQDGTVNKFARILRQRDECCLGDILREMSVLDHPQGGGVDQIDVAPHQFGKRALRATFGVIAQQV